MAKKTESIYKSWNEVDAALKELGELNVAKTRIEGEQTLKINSIKADANAKSAIIQTRIKEIEKNIERFTDANKSEFLSKRTKKLTYGVISFRLVRKVCCNCIEEAIKGLKVLNLDFCIRTKQELDKDRLLECDENMLLKAGISIKTEDKVRIEPNFEKLAAISSETNKP